MQILIILQWLWLVHMAIFLSNSKGTYQSYNTELNARSPKTKYPKQAKNPKPHVNNCNKATESCLPRMEIDAR